ncbi:MAG: glycosyltransferase family 39 protein [Chloroflexi bacterium]|nr:glycosyltransferase family 39 protein [Chloroflexota bacterium]
MSARTERTLLVTILGLFVLLGMVYSVVVPPFEASDEKWHYPMVRYIADNWSLPVQDPGVETAWRQEGSQAPLYYALAAAATFWIDTSDMETVRHLNPYVDAGATPDGNVNLAVHNPALEHFPWQGTVLAVHLVRFLSVLMGAAAVYLTYLIVRQVLPNQPALALGAATIHAFTPMYVFISASVNNDNLAVPLSSLALLILLRMTDPKSQTSNLKSSVISYLSLGSVLGLAALTKSNSLPLTVLTALVVVVRAVQRRSWGEFFVGGLATLVPFLAIAGWWSLRNLRLYGDFTGLNAFKEILGTRDVPADLAQLWRERYSFLAGYWGNFGGLNVPMASWVYPVLNTLLVVAALGLVVLLIRRIARPEKHLVIRHLPLIICFLWALSVFVQWLWWARDTWSSQGRLVFYAIPVWSLSLALGLAGWFPRRRGQWAVAVFAAFLLILAIATPWLWIQPAYALPEPLTNAQAATIPLPLEADFGGIMRLLGYDLETEAVKPGEQVWVTLYWEALAPADRDYTVFVHLLGEHDLLVAQRDTFPGLGLLSTTWLEPGYRWADRYAVQVPDTAYAPDVAQVKVGLFDAASEQRLTASSGSDNVRFGQVVVQARPGDVPNPTSVNFGNRMELVGYDLDRRVARPGEEVTLTLYWRGLRQMETNYTISTQFVDAAQIKVAQKDAWPLDGAAPTAAWEPGSVVKDPLKMTISHDAQPGAYDVQVVVYALKEGEIIRLPVISAGGEMLSSHVLLTKVRVMP